MTRCLAKGLCQIAETLPKIDFAVTLYPTERMKRAVAELYAQVIRFLIRAQDWYEESRASHVLHSITRPVELRYADLISDIKDCSMLVEGLASAGAQAEQRDMHIKIRELAKNQAEMQQLIISRSE